MLNCSFGIFFLLLLGSLSKVWLLFGLRGISRNKISLRLKSDDTLQGYFPNEKPTSHHRETRFRTEPKEPNGDVASSSSSSSSELPLTSGLFPACHLLKGTRLRQRRSD